MLPQDNLQIPQTLHARDYVPRFTPEHVFLLASFGNRIVFIEDAVWPFPIYLQRLNVIPSVREYGSREMVDVPRVIEMECIPRV